MENMCLAFCAFLAVVSAFETKTPPIGYTSAEISLADATVGMFTWSSSLFQSTLASLDITDELIGVNLLVDFGATSGGILFTEANPDPAVSQASIDTTFHLDQIDNIETSGKSRQYIFTHRRDVDFTVLVESICSTPCISTSEVRAAISLFQIDYLENNILPRITAWESRDLNSAPLNMQWSDFPVSELRPYMDAWETTNPDFVQYNKENMNFHPLPIVLPADRPEIQTLPSSHLWLGTDGDEFVEQTDGSLGVSMLLSWDMTLDAGLDLYSTVKLDTFALDTKLVLCYKFDEDPISAYPMGIELSNLTDYCDFCYPESCISDSAGTLDVNAAVQGVDSFVGDSVYVSTWIYEAGAVSTDHSVCHAWGHPCSPASISLPSMLLGVVALLLAVVV